MSDPACDSQRRPRVCQPGSLTPHVSVSLSGRAPTELVSEIRATLVRQVGRLFPPDCAQQYVREDARFFRAKRCYCKASVVALIRFRDRMDRCWASVFLPVRVRFGVEPACFLQSVDENRGGHAVVTQRLKREVRRHIPTRLKRRFGRLQGLGVTAAEASVRGHVDRTARLRVMAARTPSLQRRLCGSAWARQGYARCARR